MTAHFIGGDTSRLKVVATGHEIEMLKAWVKRLRSERGDIEVPSSSDGPGYFAAEVVAFRRTE
jgi:hypothetical protein